MSGDWENAWDRMEARVFEALCTAVESQAGVDAFRLDDLPRALEYTDEEHTEWVLTLGGGEVSEPRQSRKVRTCGMWETGGEIAVRGTSAPAVRRKAAQLFGALPLDEADVPALARLWATTYPEITRQLAPTSARTSAGEEIVVFYARFNLRAVFSNPEP